MKITFLGTGTSTGVPEIGCTCDVCKSSDVKDKRLRASVLINMDGKNILIDCGPDFRQQMLQQHFDKLHGVLLTHEHYDHVGGIDDLRPFCKFGDIDIYTEPYVADALKNRIPYCFEDNKYPGIPNISITEIGMDKFSIENISITPIRLMHHLLPITGFRINNFAYLTDLKTIPESEFIKLQNLDALVINALRIKEHISHQTLEQALVNIQKIAPKKAYLTHISHHLGLHEAVQSKLPANVFLAYDSLIIESE
ncbi:MBL fold metallo-hydrolase [Dysgonomonas sp. 520]|uniref:MBL fold metallo-hydrolase n=1 Tax=Dysgonomonas sp. 520 TaxID=2302931 RepID=UPI0013D4F296|nr:MBL fold metallo-hydrolase [Dysgonomonas sp. 520]NDW09174.1 MBL fold metallo-hydrolase [Dysgonomonas sp. 520]